MKKIILSALAGALVMFLTIFGIAAVSVSWEQVLEPRLYVHVDYVSELTQEDVDKGFIAHFLDEDQTAQVSVVYVDVDGTTLEEYEKMLPDYGVSDIEELVINDIPALSYTVEETDSVTIAFETEGGYILEITMAPKSAEGADIAWYIVASSIMEEE